MLVLTFAVLLCSAARADDEPRYAGRTVAEWNDWFKEIELASSAAARSAPELAALAADAGAPAVTRRQATLTLGRIETSAASSVPLFRQLLNDAAPTAINDVPRSWALKGIALLGPPARELTPDIIRILRDPATSSLDRLLSLEALARIGPTHAQTLSALVSALENGPPVSAAGPASAASDLEFRTAAAGVISLFGNSAVPAIPSLLRAARSSHEPLRRAAVTTLGTIGDGALIDPLADILLFDDSPAVCDAAAVSLSQLGPRSMEIFIHLLTDPDPAARTRAADGLRRLGKPARQSLPALTVTLKDESAEVRITATEAVWAVTGEVAPALDPAANLLAEPAREVRMRAHRLLIDMGRTTRDPALIERLQTLAESRDLRVRQAAYIALREIQQGSAR